MAEVSGHFTWEISVWPKFVATEVRGELAKSYIGNLCVAAVPGELI